MPLAEDIITARYSIQGYDQGQVTINETRYHDSLILSPDQLISPWPVNSIDDLDSNHLDEVIKLKPDVVLLGTGQYQHFPDPSIFGLFAELQLGLEVMNNGALCRTFNILVAEDRNVVAAIIQPTQED